MEGFLKFKPYWGLALPRGPKPCLWLGKRIGAWGLKEGLD